MKSKNWTIAISVLALLFLLTANFALWLNNSIFNRENFVNTTVDVIQEPEVRAAVSAEVVDTALKDAPAVNSVIGEPIKSAISGLLAGRRFEPVLAKLAEKLNQLITAKKPQAVAVDISTVKGFIKPLAGALDNRFGKTIATNRLPNSIVLIDKGEIPSIYSWAVILLWVGPVLGLVGLAFFAGMTWRGATARRPETIKIAGTVLAIGSFAFMVLARLLKAPLLASIASSNGKIVADNLFDAYVGQLIAQTWIPAAAGLLLIGAGYLLSRAWREPAAEQRLKEAA